MSSMLKSLKLLSDPTRLRILMLVAEESLSVAELQEILGMGQSRISTQLSQLKAAGLGFRRAQREKQHVFLHGGSGSDGSRPFRGAGSSGNPE